MRRNVKKGVAFLLALSMMSSLYHPVKAQASEKANETVTIIEETKYDEAVTFSDKVFLLENGKFANSYESFEYKEEKQYSNISTDTNIVFMDADGKKITINNKDNNGNKLFDAVYPMISLTYEYDLVKVIKDHKISYITEDGLFFGDSLKFYTYAEPMSDSLIIVSDDEINYNIINEKGAVVQKNLTGVYDYFLREELIFVYGEKEKWILDTQGNLVQKYDATVSTLFLENGYTLVTLEDKKQLYDEKFNLVVNLSVEYDGISTEYIDNGILLISDIYKEGEVYRQKQFVMDINTQKNILETSNHAVVENGVMIADNKDFNPALYSLDGTIMIEDIENLVLSVPEMECDNGYVRNTRYLKDKLYVGFCGSINGEDIVKTFVFDKASGFAPEKAKVYGGEIRTISCDEKYFITTNDIGYAWSMVDIKSGKVIKDFGDNKVYWNPRNISSSKYLDGEDVTKYMEAIPFWIEIYSNGQHLGSSYITSTGKIGKTYQAVYMDGSFIIGEYDSFVNCDVINSAAELVYSEAGADAKGFWWKDYFYVIKDDKSYLYDGEGNVVYGSNEEYIGLGYTGSHQGLYYAHEKDKYSRYYYENAIMENELFITKAFEGFDMKYGVATFAEYKEAYTGLKNVENQWLMYEDGVVTGKYHGLVKYNDQWWYVKNSKIDFGYTGLAKHAGSWWYISGGKVNFNYTGLCYYNGSWWYVSKGMVSFGTTSLCQYNGSWWYVSGGKVDFNYTGLCYYNGSWWCVSKGKVNFGTTGLCQYNGSWWYVSGGKVNFNYTGLCYYNGSWWYVSGGKVNFGYVGLAKYNGSWWYVKGGKVDFGYSGLCKYGGNWYYVEKGKLNWNYSALCKYGGSWYYVNKGILNWNYSGLCKYGGNWYYVERGILNWNYTGLCKYGSNWYYVNKGILNWNYSGNVSYGGSNWIVQNGIMVRKA